MTFQTIISVSTCSPHFRPQPVASDPMFPTNEGKGSNQESSEASVGWKPISDIVIAQNILKTKKSNIGNFLPPFELLKEPGRIANLTREEKQDILGQIERVKKDFFHKNMDSESMLPDSLNGNTASNSLFSFIFDLKCYLKPYPDDVEVREMLDLFVETYKFVVEADVISRIKDDRSKKIRREQFVDKIKMKLETLQDGERFLYAPAIGGHLILMEYKCRIENGKRVFDVKIINSGDGVENHHSKSFLGFLNPNAKFQTYLVEGADAKTVTEGRFVDKILEKEVPSEVKGSDIPIIGWFIKVFSRVYRFFDSIPEVYKAVKVDLIKNAGGKKIISDDSRLTHKPQRNGICSRKVYAYWMKENLPNQIILQDFKLRTMEMSMTRLRAAKELEGRIKGTKPDKESLAYKLFVKPHWFSKLIMFITNEIETESMILIGEKVLAHRKTKLEGEMEKFRQQKFDPPRLLDFPEEDIFPRFNRLRNSV